jgi:23S rRNA (guanosine2251-2'-O)-methyltransferase
MQTVICGFHAVITALEHHSEKLLTLYCQENKAGARVELIYNKAKETDISIHTISSPKLDKLTNNENHQGFAAVFRAAPPQGEADLLAWLETTTRTPLLLILEGLEDPHNVGACMRSAEALGVDWVILPRSRSVLANTTVNKVSCGAFQRLSIITVANSVRFIEKIKKYGIWVIGTSVPGDHPISPLSQVDFTAPVAIVMGSESTGLRRLTLNACDTIASIPLLGMTESLNVSVATGICLYECARQRGKQVVA